MLLISMAMSGFHAPPERFIMAENSEGVYLGRSANGREHRLRDGAIQSLCDAPCVLLLHDVVEVVCVTSLHNDLRGLAYAQRVSLLGLPSCLC